MNTRRVLRVKEVALLAGVTVRALHHYDELGLLVPGQRSRSGYRLYTEQDLLRLQQILIGRELGLPLEEIRRSLDDPRFDLKKTLRS
jgi:DNA-binding transcriptional MerR regulator